MTGISLTNRTLSCPCVLQIVTPCNPSCPGVLQIVGLEPRLAMWQYAEDNAREAGFSLSASAEGFEKGDGARDQRRRLRIVQGTAEAMPFADGEFDAVVCTLVRGGEEGCTMGFSFWGAPPSASHPHHSPLFHIPRSR